MTLQERLAKAETCRSAGYNCAQCVLVAFSDLTGLSDDEAMRMAIGLGGGCGSGEICGVLSAMALVRGMLTPGAPSDKGAVYADMRKLTDEFSARFGAVACRDLKASGAAVPCNTLIYEGIEILHNALIQ